jgi:alkylation response protein AidB-like acyl-CoA dehydrogenase
VIEFALNETQQMVQKAAAQIAGRLLAPRAATRDREGTFPLDEMSALAEAGLLGVNVPEELGGAGAGVVAYAVAMEEIARADASVAVTMAVTNMVAEVITRFGTEAQRRKYVPKLTSGEAVAGSFALSEPQAGSDPAGMTTTATRTGDGWVLDGAKQWITSGDRAGVMVVWAKSDRAAGAKGISCFLVERGTPGLHVGKHEDKMGIRGSSTVPLTFDGCRVPADALLGELGGGFKIALAALDGGRIGIGSQALGIGRAALEAARAYAKQRVQFGRPIADNQAIQWMLADTATELEAARCLVRRAAWLKEAGRPFTREASMAKLYATEAAYRACDRAVQIHGGYGYTREFPVERLLRDVRVTRIYEGTSEIQRHVIARALLAREGAA